GVLEEDNREFRALRTADVLPPRGVTAPAGGLRDGGPEREGFEHDGDPEHRQRDRERLQLERGHEVGDALGDGEKTPERARQERDDERPEVALLPEPEGMLGRRLSPGAPAAEEE